MVSGYSVIIINIYTNELLHKEFPKNEEIMSEIFPFFKTLRLHKFEAEYFQALSLKCLDELFREKLSKSM